MRFIFFAALLIISIGITSAAWFPNQYYNFTGTITSTTIESGADLTAAGGDSVFDWSLATGAFKTSQGTNYLGGNTQVSGTLTSTGIATLGGLNVTLLDENLRDLIISSQTNETAINSSIAAQAIAAYTNETAINDTINNLGVADSAINDTIHNLVAADVVINATTHNLQSADVEINSTIHNLQAADVNINSTVHNLQASDVAINSTTHNLQAADITINATIGALVIPLATFAYDANSVDQAVFTASGGWVLTAVKMTPRVVASSGDAVTVMVKICDSGEAPASGDNMLSGTLDLKGTADTPQSGTVSSGAIANGKIVALDFTGDLTAAVGSITIYGTRA